MIKDGSGTRGGDKRKYEPPKVAVIGSVEQLTETGTGSATESGSSSGQKKHNSTL